MNPVFTPANITSPQDMLIILVVALIVFGPRKLPEIGRQIGAAMREFNKMRGDMQKAFQLDELNHYDSTPAYHPAPYGPTYSTTHELPSVDVDVDHPAIDGTGYHDDALTHDVTHSHDAMLESIHASDAQIVSEATTAKIVSAPPPGPAALRAKIAETAAPAIEAIEAAPHAAEVAVQ